PPWFLPDPIPAPEPWRFSLDSAHGILRPSIVLAGHILHPDQCLPGPLRLSRVSFARTPGLSRRTRWPYIKLKSSGSKKKKRLFWKWYPAPIRAEARYGRGAFVQAIPGAAVTWARRVLPGWRPPSWRGSSERRRDRTSCGK